MQFTMSAAAFAAFVSAVLAQTADFDPITKPLKDEKVAAGSTYQVEWQVATQYLGPVTVSLLGGATPGTLQPLGSLGTADNADGKFSWAVDSSLGKDATYGIQITLDADKTIFQYSMPFHITGGGSGGSHSNGTATYTISSVTSSGSSSDYPTLVPSGNYTATHPPPKTTITSTQGGGGSGSTPTQTGSQTVPTSGAGIMAAPLALIGAALAAFAL